MIFDSCVDQNSIDSISGFTNFRRFFLDGKIKAYLMSQNMIFRISPTSHNLCTITFVKITVVGNIFTRKLMNKFTESSGNSRTFQDMDQTRDLQQK